MQPYITHPYRLCLCPKQLFTPHVPLPCMSPLLICNPVWLTLVLVPSRFSPGQKDHLILASSTLSHHNTEGSLQINRKSLWAQGSRGDRLPALQRSCLGGKEGD